MGLSRAFFRYIRHIHFMLLPAAVLMLAAGPGIAQNSQSKPVRVVLKGYDPVAYFTERKPVKGNPGISYDWDGERYLFANAANKGKFAANPDKFAPQFGGYCTGTMARGSLAEADPNAFIIADGKLYLFGQMKFKEMAESDSAWLAGRVVAAADHWRARK